MMTNAARRPVLLAAIVMALAVISPGPTLFAATKAEQYGEVFEVYEEYEGSVYMGVSGPYLDKAEGFRQALTNACTMAAVAQSVRMRADYDIRVDDRRDINSMDVYSSAVYDQETLNDVYQNMELVSLEWFGGEVGAVAFIRYGSVERIEWDHDDDWTSIATEYPGYVFAVGEVGEYYYIQDSINAAAYDAAVNLVDVSADTLYAVNEVTRTDNSNMRVNSYQIGVNVLEGFTVLAYDYDPKTRTFYALAGAEV